MARLPLKINTTYYFLPITYCFKYAGVAELADALDLGSSVFDVQVQVLSPAPKNKGLLRQSFIFIQSEGLVCNLA